MATELIIKESSAITPSYSNTTYVFNYYESGAPSNPTKIDVYPIQVSTSGYYKIQSNSDYDVVGYLFDSSNAQLIMNDNHPASDRNFELVYYFQPGQTYYLGAKPYSYTNIAACSIPIKFSQCFQFTVSAGTGGSATIDGQSSRWLYSQEYGYCQAINSSGYTFDHWYENDIAQNYADEVFTYLSEQNRHLEARFIKDSYTITYNANGGDVSPTTQTVTAGSSTTTPTATRDPYTDSKTFYFNPNGGSTTKTSQTSSAKILYSSAGWYTAASGGTKRADNGGNYSPSSSETLYAQWEKWYPGYNDITFPTSTECTRNGYILSGFATSSTATSATYAPGETISVYSTTVNTTWYAIWKANTTYKITFNANGGSGVPGSIEKTGETASEVVMGDIGNTVPTRSGYTFRGWSSTSSYSENYRIAYTVNHGGDADLNGIKATITNSSWTFQDYCEKTGASKNITTLVLYAQWESNTYTITYDANGGSSTPSSQSIAVGSTASLASAISRNSSTVDGYTVSFNNSQTGITSKTQQNTISYTFKEWNTNSRGTGTSYAAGASLTPSTSGSITLYAIWNETTTLGSITAPTIKSYTATSVKEVEVYRNDGSGNSSILESKAISSYSPSGWYTASSGGIIEVSSGATFTPTSSTTLYAQWEETTGTYPNVSLPSNWTRDDWTLLGFSTSSSATSATYALGASVSPNNTYYAIWEKTITLSYDSGDISPQSITIYNATNSATFTISSTVPTRTGYTFAYWTDRSNSYDPKGSITLTKNTTLSAVWRTNSHTLTTKVNPDNSGYIEINGVQTSLNTFNFNYDTTVTLTACANPGYSFMRWEDNNSTANPRSLKMPDNNVTVEAVFGEDIYSLNINSNTDIKVWMRSEKENGTWSDWLQLSDVNNLSGAQTCQFVFEDGEEYEFTSCSNGSTFIEEYTNYLISESMTLTVLGTKIPTINKIYVGNELKTSGYINDPEVSFNENIKSIWIGDKQIMGKAPTRKYHYKKDTILRNTLYIGYEESEVNKFEAFYKYTNLETVIFPPYEIAQKYFDIGTRAFFDNKNLSKVNLNNSVQTISWTAFYGCSNLKKIFIPASVSDMSKNPFRYGAGIEKFRVDKNNLYYSTDFQGILYNKNMTKIESYTIGKKKPYYIFPKSVTIIGDYAFSNTGSLKEIYYEGTEEEWNSIEILSGNNNLSNGIIEIIFNYKEEK